MKNAPKNPVLDQIRKNLMVELEERRAQLRASGKKLYDLGLGDPREPTPLFIREALRVAVPESSQYPSIQGTPALRRACAGYLQRRFAVKVDPDQQIVPASGAKEAIFHAPLAFAAPGGRRMVVMPDPGYPTYEAGTRFAGLEPVKVALQSGNGFLLEPEALPEATLRDTLLFWVNYPNNPTGAVAPRAYLERLGRAALKHGFIVCSDECYTDIYLGEERPLSMLEIQQENVIALFSCSKRSGMTGYRSGFVAGDSDLVARLKALRAHPGVGSPDFVSASATAAWADDQHPAERRAAFRRKRDLFLRFFSEHGLSCDTAEATIYLWVRVPKGETSLSYALRLLEEGIMVSPGTAFGAGEGYIRVALAPLEDECREAIERWARVKR